MKKLKGNSYWKFSTKLLPLAHHSWNYFLYLEKTVNDVLNIYKIKNVEEGNQPTSTKQPVRIVLGPFLTVTPSTRLILSAKANSIPVFGLIPKNIFINWILHIISYEKKEEGE